MIVIVAGPSGVGKSRFIEYAVSELNYVRTVPYTTRERRANERDGVDYNYLTRDEFQRRIADDWFVDWDFTVGNYYGYGPELKEVAARGTDTAIPVVARMAIRLRRLLPNPFLLFIDGDQNVLRKRVAGRSLSTTERILRDEHADEERELAGLFDYRWTPGDHFDGANVASALIEARARWSH